MRGSDHDEVSLLRPVLAATAHRARHPAAPLAHFAADPVELLEDFDGEDEADLDLPPAALEEARRRQAALLVAATGIIDRCIDDLRELEFGDDGLPDPDQAEESFVFERFPARHRASYDEVFFRKVLVTVVKVAQDLADPNGEPAACTAEEIVRDAVIDEALRLCEAAGLGRPWLHPSETLLEDTDFEYLFAADMDGHRGRPRAAGRSRRLHPQRRRLVHTIQPRPDRPPVHRDRAQRPERGTRPPRTAARPTRRAAGRPARPRRPRRSHEPGRTMLGVRSSSWRVAPPTATTPTCGSPTRPTPSSPSPRWSEPPPGPRPAPAGCAGNPTSMPTPSAPTRRGPAPAPALPDRRRHPLGRRRHRHRTLPRRATDLRGLLPTRPRRPTPLERRRQQPHRRRRPIGATRTRASPPETPTRRKQQQYTGSRSRRTPAALPWGSGRWTDSTTTPRPSPAKQDSSWHR